MELTVSNRTVVRVVLIVLALISAIALLASLRTQLVWVFTAFFLALALEPAVDRLSRFMPRRSRGLAVLLVLLATLALFGFVLFVLIPPFATQLFHLVTNLPAAYETFLNDNPTMASFINGHLHSAQTSNAISDFSKQALSFGGSAVGVVSGIFGGVVAVVTVLLITFFMVLEGPRWIEIFWQYGPKQDRAKRKDLLRQMHRTITGYVNGNIFTSIIASVSATIMLLILHAPYAFALGLLVGLVDLIPMVGATLAGILVAVTVLVFKGLAPAAIYAIYFIIYQQIENNILQPLVFAKAVEVSPLVTILALIVGAALAGFIGALVAIPMAASLQILARYYLKQRLPDTREA